MLLSDTLLRTWRISCGPQTGSGFVFREGEASFLATAKHLVEQFPDQELLVWRNGRWNTAPAQLVGRASDSIDIAVFRLNLAEHSPMHATLSPGSWIFGQDAFILGFPYNMSVDLGSIASGWVAPLIKKGVISGTDNDPRGEIYLDIVNNPGFSGGPVVINPDLDLKKNQVIGLVSGYRTEDCPVLHGTDEEIASSIVRVNSGITIANSIQSALDMARGIGIFSKN